MSNLKASLLENPIAPITALLDYQNSATVITSLLHLLDLSTTNQSLKLTHQLHARTHRLGLAQHSLIATKLIFSYSYFNSPQDARLIFTSFCPKNTFLYNTLLSGYARNNIFHQSLHLFKEMCRKREATFHAPDEFTYSIVCKVTGELKDPFMGGMVHGNCLKIGFLLDIVVSNSLINLYSKCGNFGDCLKVFDEMPCKNVSSWNVIISGYLNSKEGNSSDSAWDFVRKMQVAGLDLDAYTVSSLLSLCGGGEDGKKWGYYGRELHCYALKNAFFDLEGLSSGSDLYLGCCLIDMYSKCGRIDLGRHIFDKLKQRNVYAWTALVNGYVHNEGDFNEALAMFREMQYRDSVEPNKVSLVSILPACSSFAGLLGGKQIHAFAIRRELNHEPSLCNAMIDMYFKCGSLRYARLVFDHDCVTKDAISWTSMISGYGLHGKGEEAVESYNKMLCNGIKPDMITVVGVLSACSKSGLVHEGTRIYGSAVTNYGVEPTPEICACMVDMLGRSGQLDRALDFIKNMPVEPGASVWGALVSASALHGDSAMRNLAYKVLIEMEPQNPGNYISLSNLYAASRDWDSAAEVRMKMKERKLKKMPGCSWISINSQTHSFLVADKSHPCSDLIYERLDELVLAMKGAGHINESSDLLGM